MGSETGNMFIHPQGRYFSKTFLFIGALMICVPLILTLVQIYWPLVFVPFGFLFYIPKQQVEIDFDNKRYRDCSQFLHYKTGKWASIEKATAINMKTVAYSILMSAGHMGLNSREDKVYVVSLEIHVGGRIKIEIDEFEDPNKAIHAGTEIALGLGIPFYDSTSGDGPLQLV